MKDKLPSLFNDFSRSDPSGLANKPSGEQGLFPLQPPDQSPRRAFDQESPRTNRSPHSQRDKFEAQKRSIVRQLNRHRIKEERRRKENEALEPRRQQIRDMVYMTVYSNARLPALKKCASYISAAESKARTLRAEKAEKRLAATMYMQEAEKNWSDRIRNMNDHVRQLRSPKKKEEVFFDSRAVLMDGDRVVLLPSISNTNAVTSATLNSQRN